VSPPIGSTSTEGVTGTNRARPGLDQALAAVRAGDTLVVPKIDRLAQSVPDAREIGDSLVPRGVKLSLGGQIYDPTDPMGKMFFNILATFADWAGPGGARHGAPRNVTRRRSRAG
jgi:DNA invertase Pin-like site-specific DNA recombinase